MALLDEGETDWKVIVVDVQDPLASKLNDIEDVERHLPVLIRATNEWFRSAFSFVEFDSPLNAIYCRIYKIPDGKPENAFAFSGEAKNKKYEQEILQKDQEILSLQHKLSILDADLEKAETKLSEHKTLHADGDASRSTNESLNRKIQLREEELDAAEKNAKETVEKCV